MRLKVLLMSNIPSPYFVNYADELSKYVDLTVVFELRIATNRDDTWSTYLLGKKFTSFILNAKRRGNDAGLSFKIRSFLKDKTFNRIIIANPTTPTGIIALLYCRRHKISFIIQSEGGFQGSGKGLKEKFKKYIMEKATMYLTGMGGDDDYFLMYGATKDKLKPYHFTSSYAKDIDDTMISLDDKIKLKKELGINQDKMILYVGQFIQRKGIDILLKSFVGLDDNTCLYLIGGEMKQEYMDIINDYNIKNVYAIPFKTKKELRNYYRTADIFVMTTREDTWGLVINEAMEHALPVITTDRCIAGRYLIKNGINGYVVENENILQTHDRIYALLSDDKLRLQIGKNNLNRIKTHTIENMAKQIYEYIK